MKLKDINDYQEEIINDSVLQVKDKLLKYEKLTHGAIKCPNNDWQIIDLALFTYGVDLDNRIKKLERGEDYEL